MMADLSGYTALTEAHGASSAADVIDKYIDIVKKCLVGESELHERTGDAIMIVSATPDFLLSTAIMILQTASLENNFLQLHGGLHYGKILSRNNSYFGTAVNLTSRIAAQASPGTFLCSGDFVNSLSDKTLIRLHSQGKHRFKNLNEEQEIFEIEMGHSKTYFIDPVCRMLILDVEKAISHPRLPNIFFCSEGCLEKYNKN
jgi:adenylate cyclase